MIHRIAVAGLVIALGLLPRQVSGHGLTNHPSGWTGVVFDITRIVLVASFVILLVLTVRDRSG